VKPRSRRPKKVKKGTPFLSYGVSLFSVAICVAAFLFFRSQTEATVRVEKPIIVASEDDLVLVPTPLRPIAKGEKLGAVTFVRTKWQRSKLTMSYVEDVSQVAESVALVSLPANLPIPASAISIDRSVGNEVVDRIPAEMRAITVRVDAESAVEGWARPGDFVDVILLRSSAERDVGIEAKVIAENVKILSAGRSTEPLGGKESSARAPATVTILVDQQNALKVKAASNIGKLTFALRGTGDTTPTLAKRMDQKTLLGRARAYTPQKRSFVGRATGPDGKTYLLSEDARWVRESSEAEVSKVENSMSKDPTE
jgi:Flp pilus assembly protein CpaB